MNKKSLIFIISYLITCSVFFETSISTVKAEAVNLFEQQKLTSHLLINLFLEKLDQGGLVVFKQTISRSDLQPHQVSYVHNIADDSLLVRLCFNLQRKILVPKFEHFFVAGITVETDKDGNIIKIMTRVSALEKSKTTEDSK